MNQEDYKRFQGLLLYFMSETVESYEPLSDEELIEFYLNDVSKKEANMTIQEAKAILKEDPFPEDWIVNTAMRGPFLSEEDLEKRNKGLPYHSPTLHEWVEWMIIELEKGIAEKYGDLDSK